MTKSEQLEQLKLDLSILKSRFKTESIFDKGKLDNLIFEAKSRHNKYEEFVEYGLHTFPEFLREKYSQGYSFEPAFENIQHHPISGMMVIKLIKPQRILDPEYAALETTIRQKFQEEFEQNKSSLIAEIADHNLKIKEAEEAIKSESKRSADLVEEIQRVQQELLENSGSEKERTNAKRSK